MPNPLGGMIFLGGAYLLTEAGRIYWPWLARRHFLVALALVFFAEVIAVMVGAAMFKG